MPLPAALIARLKKRGIVHVDQTKDAEEEVFAEEYDQPTIQQAEVFPEEEIKNAELVYEVAKCPNRDNPYHLCVEYCRERYGLKGFSPCDEETERRRERMLHRFPLPDLWRQVADPETGRYYYWHTETGQVSWLSPTHPKAVLSLSKERLIKMGVLDPMPKTEAQAVAAGGDSAGEEASDSPSDASSSDSNSDNERDRRRRRERERGASGRDRDRERRRERSPDDDRRFRRPEGRPRDRDRGSRRRERKEEFDPMDPSSYSECPRGTWSSGLDQRGEAKTGVDVTASGPLFQQRPYPSPGQILKANMAKKK